MKPALLLLLLFTLPLSSHAQDRLIQVPREAVREGGGPAQPSGRLNFDLGLEGLADSADPETYVRWMQAQMEAQRKGAMAGQAVALRQSPQVACLPFHDAFGFEKLSETEYKLNCFAGNGRNISHVLDYHMTLSYLPHNCGSDERIRDFFRIPTNRNRASARDFWSMIKSTCQVVASPVSPSAPIVRSTGVTREFVDQALEQKEDLRLYVNRSRDRKESGSDQGERFTNPLRSGGSQPAN